MQAARGTSLNSVSSGDDSSLRITEPPRSRAPYLVLFAVVALTLYAVDQVTKYLAVAHLTGEPDRPLVGDILMLHLTRNAGAAFSAGTGYTEVFSCLAIAASLVVLWLSRRLGSAIWAVALGLLLAGIAGNLTDRLFRAPGPLRGEVVDFLMLPHWPIFNVADMCINAAAVLILVQAFRGIRLDGTGFRDSHGDQEEASTPADDGGEP